MAAPAPQRAEAQASGPADAALHLAVATAAPERSAAVGEAGALAAPKSAAIQPAVQQKTRHKGKQLSESARAEAHQQALQTAFADFKCNCELASKAGVTSCLDQFSKKELQGFYAETYGASTGTEGGKKVKLSKVSDALHAHVWALKVALPEMDAQGRQYDIPKWTLEGKQVCKEAWQRARGGSERRVRDVAALVRRGYGPAEAAAGHLAKLEMAMLRRQSQTENARRQWAENWWAQELLLHDWLPNEQAVRFRGQGYGFIHEHVFSPAAEAVGIQPVSYKLWRGCSKAGLIQLHEQNHLPGSDIAKLRLKRSAKHSAFPECTECQERRKAYYAAAKERGANPNVVAEKYNAVLQHQKEWGDDRKAALRLKYGTFHAQADACYECDDGCGSFWQGLPVDPTGRDSKRAVAAKYKFCVQANVICGPGGVQRFAVMPKNVRKGANFGLSNLILVLHGAWKAGRLGPHVTRAYRHTDGGPDNVSWVSHFLHWLLVYIGVLQDLLWFRFEAGHSHTEIADRLFSVMKRLFESDSNQRVGPLESFADLERELRASFAKAQEHFELAFHLANWDFEGWFNSFKFDHDSAFQPSRQLVDSNFGGYSFDLVFRYEYVGAELWQHGGVKVGPCKKCVVALIAALMAALIAAQC